MSLVINANSCRITDSRNLSGAHDFLRTKILKSKICSRANLGYSSVSVVDKLCLSDKLLYPHDNDFFDTISGYLDTKISALSNISDILERLISVASEDQANQDGTVKLNGESSFLLARVCYFASQLSSEDQLIASFRVSSGMKFGIHSDRALDRESKFRRLLKMLHLPRTDGLIHKLSNPLFDPCDNAWLGEVKYLLADTRLILKKLSCCNRELSQELAAFADQVKISNESVTSVFLLQDSVDYLGENYSFPEDPVSTDSKSPVFKIDNPTEQSNRVPASLLSINHI